MTAAPATTPGRRRPAGPALRVKETTMDDDLPHPLRRPAAAPPPPDPRFTRPWLATRNPRFAPGWWLLPAALVGTAGWFALLFVAVGRFLK
jgi:hypothetical protein